MDNHYLADNCLISFDSRKTGTNNNVLVVGTNGCGKTMSVVEPLILHTMDHSLVVSLSKRTLVDKYMKVVKNNGFKVIDLNFASPQISPYGFDPLHFIKDDLDIRHLAESISLDPGKSSDPFWENTAIDMISGLIAYEIQVSKREKRYPSLKNIVDMANRCKIVKGDFSDIASTSLDKYFLMEERRNPDNYASKCWKTITTIPARTLGTIITCVSTAISSTFPESIIKLSENKCIDINKLGDEKTVLFLTTSAVNTALTNYMNIFYSILFKQLFEHAENDFKDSRLAVPVHVVCDDFACGATIPDFDKYISIFRAKGISTTLLIQAESQLRTLYRHSQADTIINNCDTYLYMGGMDPDTCLSISKRADLPFSDVMNMPVTNVIVLHRGSKPIVSERYKTLEDPDYIRYILDYNEMNLKAC